MKIMKPWETGDGNQKERAAHGKLIFRKILLIRATTGQILEMEIKQQRLPIENKFAEAFI